MLKLHNEQDAIKQAIEAGYDPTWMPPNMGISPSRKVALQTALAPNVLQDPAFWQALGKARADNSNIIGGWIAGKWTWVKIDGKEWWLHHALRYFETLLSGGDMQKFWEELP